MSRTTVELDFFGMEKDNSNPNPHLRKSLDHRRSFRGIQSAISKINPEVVKSVIASNNPFAPKTSFSVPSTPKIETLDSFIPLPVYTPFIKTKPENDEQSSPLTIFYNGTVTVFNVPRDKAESILKLAVEVTDSKSIESENSNAGVSSSSEQEHLLNTLNGDLPLFRKRSLERFLEKRKERLTSVSPYVCHS